MEKRFSFSPEKFERDKRTGIQKAIEALQKKYPEILGMTLFGSLTKRESSKSSRDIDEYVFLDPYKVAKKENKKIEEIIFYPYINAVGILNGKAFNPRFTDEIDQRYKTEIRQKLLQNNPELTHSQMEHLWVFPISEAIVNNFIDSNIDEQYYLEDAIFSGLFHLRVGQGKEIQKYRKMIIDKLYSLGQRGEEIWNRIIHAVALAEQDTRVEGTETRVQKTHYPQTIEAARRVYG